MCEIRFLTGETNWEDIPKPDFVLAGWVRNPWWMFWRRWEWREERVAYPYGVSNS